MRLLFRRMFSDLRRGENVDAYLTVIVAITVALLNLLGVVTSTSLTSLMLGVLALLAVGILATRARLDQLRDAVTQRNPLTSQRSFPSSYAEDLAATNDLWLFGVSRTNLIRTHYHHLADRLRAGRSVRVLLVKPGSPAARLAQQRVPIAIEGGEDYQIRASIDLVSALRKETGGRIELRLTEQEPAFGAAFINPDSSAARLYLEYYAYKTRHDSPLRLTLTRRDGDWFDHYREQLDELWNDAEPGPEVTGR